MPIIYNIPSSVCFVETLAEKLLQEYQNRPLDLADVLVFLPNRRACRSLSEAFVRLQGLKPTLLPHIRPLGDIEEDELLLSGSNCTNTSTQLLPAIDPLERTMLFMRLIISRYADFGLEKISLAQACSLAQELGRLIDSADMQNLNWNNLQSLVPEEYAAHWQETLKFLQIITAYWPQILNERGVIDAAKRKNELIAAQSKLWQAEPPQKHIIIAGTTAVSQSMKLIVQTVTNLPHGEIYLAGLDKYLDDESWQQIDESHPQFELKQLLDFLEIERHSVPDLIPPANPEREKLISEIMRPAATSNLWRQISGTISEASVKGLNICECTDDRTEAITIALLLRQILEKPEKTAALITPDRSLARRVTSELLRWNIEIDDSAGIPLAQSPWGIFMRLVATIVLPNSEKKEILALLKNPLFSLGQSREDIQNITLLLDKNLWRKQQADEQAQQLLSQLKSAASNFISLCAQPQVELSTLIKAHINLAEILASTDKETGSSILWKNEDGHIGAEFMADWLAKAECFNSVPPAEYLGLFTTMMSNIMVRSTSIKHPRLRILGPIEARLNHYDTIILGGFNEGIWPPAATADPWMSRPMKKEFGFEQPEKQIGVLALDLANLFGAPQIWITRTQLSSGTPTVKSRWLMRLETVLQALSINHKSLENNSFNFWAQQLDKPTSFVKISAPNPHPPISARPRIFSATSIEKLMRDPYTVFAEYILKLKPLDELNPQPDASDLGAIIHTVLENFGTKYPNNLPQNAEQILLQMGDKAFTESNLPVEKQAFWRPKFSQIVKWLTETENNYRQTVKHLHTEIKGLMTLSNLPAGPIQIEARADRIDTLTDGSINIIDYKTGRARSATEIKKGYSPQLPIEGLIAETGGFPNLPPTKVNSLMYWKLGHEVITIKDNIPELLSQTKEHLLDILNRFDFETTGYLSRPNPKHAPDYSDYEHLARVREWSVKDESEDE